MSDADDGNVIASELHDLCGSVEEVARIRDAIDGGEDLIRSDFAPQNLVDAVADVARQSRSIANAITPTGASGGVDAMGGHVESLTEAVMGMTKALCAIGFAIESVAAAIGKVNRS